VFGTANWVADRFGSPNAALLFSGDSYLLLPASIPSALVVNQQRMTFSVWLYIESSLNFFILDNGNSSWHFEINPTSFVARWSPQCSGTFYYVFPLYQWFNLVYITRGALADIQGLFVNGNRVATVVRREEE
jgi:hypothetical protein